MRRPRFQKLLGDVRVERSRLLLLVVAVAVSLTAVGGVLGAFAILRREMAAAYLGTHPASATLELEGDVDAEVLALARSQPGVRDASARDVLVARARVGDGAAQLLLFVVDDFADLRVATLRSVAGAWPPPDGTVLLERSALPGLHAKLGGELVVQMPTGETHALVVSGVVNDPSLAPASQEREGYAWVSRATLATLGAPPVLHELRVSFRDESSVVVVEGAAAALAAVLVNAAHPVHQIRVPPPRTHPHQRQMTTILTMMLAFSGLALVLSAVLVATSLASMLARQVREIGVMKAVGARADQIAVLYVTLVGGMAAIAVLLSLPTAVFFSRLLAAQVAGLLNFDLVDRTRPWWVVAVQIAAGLVVPLVIAAVPIRKASRATVRDTLDQHGTSDAGVRVNITALPFAARNLVRRPARTALLLLLLAVGGAIFQSALHVAQAWRANIDKVLEQRNYDVELRLVQPPSQALLHNVSSIGVAEVWGYSPAAFLRPGHIDVVRTWPDRGHGSLAVLAPPPASTLVRFPLRAGRWLADDDVDAVVLNHGAVAQLGHPAAIGETVQLSLDGVSSSWKLVGVVEEVGAAGVAYVPLARFTKLAGAGRLLRLSADDAPRAVRALDRLLIDDGVAVEQLMPLSELEAAVDGHIALLIQALIALALMMAVVGALGLGSTMSMNILERTRELGIMMALGATPARLRRWVVLEGVAVGVFGWLTSLVLSLLLTWGLDALIGSLGFMAPLPFVLDVKAPLLWLVIAVASAATASWLPALRLRRLSVSEALAHL